jgi:hypothetical protein
MAPADANRRLRLITACLLASLCGCGVAPKRTVLVEPKAPVLCQQATALPSVQMLPTPFRVVADSSGIYWIGMDGRAYENLARNIDTLRLVLNQARNIIDYYDSCVREANGRD